MSGKHQALFDPKLPLSNKILELQTVDMADESDTVDRREEWNIATVSTFEHRMRLESRESPTQVTISLRGFALVVTYRAEPFSSHNFFADQSRVCGLGRR